MSRASGTFTESYTGTGLDVRDLSTRRELEAVKEVLGLIWQRPDGLPPVQLEVLRAVVCAGSMVLGAYRGADLLGAAVGFCGQVSGEAHLHSHIVGVHPAAQGQGVGRALKWRQRDWCLRRGIGHMTWTFDPLVRRNTWFNVSKLGALGTAYHEDFYGPMPDGINAGLPTDRCLATWDLDSPRVHAARAGRLAPPDPADLPGAARVLRVGEHGEPVPAPGGGPLRLAQVPPDLENADRDLALRWRLALRGVLAGALADGLVLHGVSRDGWYLLSEPTEGAAA